MKFSEHKIRDLQKIAQHVAEWEIKTMKIKAVFHTLNLFSLELGARECLIAECWCPESDIETIKGALKRGEEKSGISVASIINRIESREVPPTCYRLNKFTQGFQNLVDAYGVATYQEVNPGLFTIITFPFLFGVMFGDFGHGLVMFIAALVLVIYERKLESMKIKDEIFRIFFGGRYIILMMGLFSIYAGLVYNEFFSRSVNVYGSSWKISINETTAYALLSKDSASGSKILLDPKWAYLNNSYPFGIDPVWNIAGNKLNFIDSFKMKMSVILGISQMLFGVILSCLNYRQMAVGYYPGPNCAPSLLIGFINLFLFKQGPQGFTDDNGQEIAGCDLNQWYPGQKYVEMGFLLFGVLCIPWMLLSKPLYLRWKNNKRKTTTNDILNSDNNQETKLIVEDESPDLTKEEKEENFDFGEVMIYQSIHTIEFCLGCISHTASYLRLWALSLAHSELSEVVWGYMLKTGFTLVPGYAGGIVLYLIFWAFAGATVVVLILMEGLSAFLHALRLHWVEFQSKFYGSDGYLFMPFSFDVILKEHEFTKNK